MGTLANSEDPDEMLHNAAFHQGIHCLLKQKRSSEKKLQSYLEIIFCDPSIYTMDHPKSNVFSLTLKDCFVCFVALRPKSTAMVMAGRSVHLTTLFPGQLFSDSCTYFRL